MKVKVIDPNTFEACVFGGESLMNHFPDLLGDGAPVLLHANGNYYFHNDGKPVDGVRDFNNSTCFLTEKEMLCVKLIED